MPLRTPLNTADYPIISNSTATHDSAEEIHSHLGKSFAVAFYKQPSSSGLIAETLYRVFEILVAAIVLVFTLPLIAISAILIRWDSPGPAFFFHCRPARSTLAHGRDLMHRTDLRAPPGGYQPDVLYYVPSYFVMPKLRTMYSDARVRYPELYSYTFSADDFHRQMPTLRHDPRVTCVGRILRRLSIDELPNFWSVLTGHMRLIGPRPEASEVLQYYTYKDMYKFSVKPGITGLAQINGRGLLNWGETLAWDLEYVRTRTVLLDLKILMITLVRVFLGYGAF